MVASLIGKRIGCKIYPVHILYANVKDIAYISTQNIYSMITLLKNFGLAVILILLASGILLISDREQRKEKLSDNATTKLPRIGIFQINSTLVLDQHISGVIDRLKSEAMINNTASNVTIFNAQGDLPMGNTIATQLVNGPFDIIITSSTVSLQIFANANQKVKKNHVFGAVTNPFNAGVGITGTAPSMHPPYIAGLGTFQPVKKTFSIAKQMKPELKKAGVVWNPGEQCSEACLFEARKICSELGIELVEAVATNTTEVADAVKALVSQGVEVIWVGGDTVAMASINLIISVSQEASIPVITNDPTDASRGALFGLGADYFTVGQYTADIAIEILRGKKPSEFGISNVLPELFEVNQSALKTFPGWQLTDDLKQMLANQHTSADDSMIDMADYDTKTNRPSIKVIKAAKKIINLKQYTGKTAKLVIVNLVENITLEEAEKGVIDGLKETGLIEGVDFTIKKYSAQGEVANLNQILESAIMDKPDAIISITTPAFIAASKKITNIPLIYTVASNPVAIGVFKDQVPYNICGVHDDPPVDRLLDMALKYNSKITEVGIIYDNSQVNAVLSVEKLRKAARERNIKVLEATASVTSDLPTATQALIQRGADALIQSADNLTATGFNSIFKVASSAKIPIFTTSLNLIEAGATGGIGDNYYEWGKQSGVLAAKVLAGALPGELGTGPTAVIRTIEPKPNRYNNK